MNAADITHPLVQAIEVKMGLGRIEAEQVLRGQAITDQAAAKAVKDIDERRAKARAQTTELNSLFAQALGMDMDGAAQLIGKLANRSDLFTWLTTRVHQTLAHDRPLAHDE